MPTEPQTRTASQPAAAGEASLLGSVRLLLEDLPGLISDRVQLLSLELQRAGQSLSQIVALVTAAAILLSTAWLALWAGIAAALVQAGIAWGWGVALVIVLNVAAAAWAIARARALSHWLRLPATVRRLTGTPAVATAAAGLGQEQAPHEPAAAASHPVPVRS
jgi:hypothetical protein